MTEPPQSAPAICSVSGRLDLLAQAGCTEDFILMLSDAFPAKKPAARRTARNRLPLHVIVAALMSDIRHN